MKHIKLFEKFVNESIDDGLFWNNSPKNKNKFLFPGEVDILNISATRSPKVAAGNNYNFAEFANACLDIGPKQQLGKDRYDVYPKFTLTIPKIATFILTDKITVDSKNLLKKTQEYVDKESSYNGFFNGVKRDGYTWMTNFGASVKVNTKTIRERFEGLVGMVIREYFASRINWGKLNILVHYNTNDQPHVFNPITNNEDMLKWLDASYSAMYRNGIRSSSLITLKPALDIVSASMPNTLTIKIQTINKI